MMFSCSPFTFLYVFSLEMENENQAACILASSDFAKIAPSQLQASLSNHSNSIMGSLSRYVMPLGRRKCTLICYAIV